MLKLFLMKSFKIPKFLTKIFGTSLMNGHKLRVVSFLIKDFMNEWMRLIGKLILIQKCLTISYRYSSTEEKYFHRFTSEYFALLFYLQFFCFIIKSRTNARFLARRHGLGGADDWEAAEIESWEKCVAVRGKLEKPTPGRCLDPTAVSRFFNRDKTLACSSLNLPCVASC